MPAIVTDSFDYSDIVRGLDLDEAFVHHQIDALPKLAFDHDEIMRDATTSYKRMR